MNRNSGHNLYHNHKHLFLFLASAFLGTVIFFLIYGFKIINPTYDDWILNKGGDVAQHYLGWKFYRNSPWHFPIGLIDGLNAYKPISCMFTDSIPLFAVFFKILSPVLPETFQYTGIWGMFCFFMMGGVSSLLLYRFNKSTPFCILGSIFFIISPSVLQRMFGHEALSGQWIIATALLFWAYQNHKWKHKATPIVLWSILGAVAVLVHIYFIPMIYAVMLGYVLTDILCNKKIIRPIICFISTTCSFLFTMFIIGGFYGEGNMQAGGLGKYSTNYNSLFNPFNYSKFLKPLNSNKGQAEGFGYLGLGIIIAGIIALVITFLIIEEHTQSLKDLKKLIINKYKIIIAVSAVIIVSMFAAASPIGTLNARTIYTIDYPDKITDILSIFRASGRFVWIVLYIVYTAVFALISKLDKKKTVIFITAFCLSIQIMDLRDFLIDKHKYFTETKNYSFELDNESYSEITAGADEIVFLPLPENFLGYVKLYIHFGEYASRHNMKLSSFYAARADYDSLSGYAAEKYKELENNSGNQNILYVFFNKNDIPESNKNLHIYEIAGYTVGRYIE